MIRVGMGGMPLKVFDPLLESVLSLKSFPSAVESSSFVARLAAVMPKFSELNPWPTTLEDNSAKRGRGREFFGGTWGWEELPGAPATPFADYVKTSRCLIDEGDRWGHLSRDSPSLLAVATFASLLETWSRPDSLRAVRSAEA
ncbi:unnamed protein product [Sphagnum jensenii]|uniref:Uncharacterized protein n=1 Tax=Sphagnum jensenii TaxID=128206 RepID=A0ABP0X972_9BRYO